MSEVEYEWTESNGYDSEKPHANTDISGLVMDSGTSIGIFFTVLFLLGFIFNLVVIWIILGHKSMRTAPNYFEANFSIVEAVLCRVSTTFSMGFTLPYVIHCVMEMLNNVLAITLVVISAYRYRLIVNPEAFGTSGKPWYCILPTVWLIAVVPSAIWFSCVAVVQRVFEAMQELPVSVLLLFTPLMRLALLIWLAVMTSNAVHGLSKFNLVQELSAEQTRLLRDNRKAVKNMLFTVVIFIICWLPATIAYIALVCFSETIESASISFRFMFSCLYMLQLSHCIVRPILNYCTDTRYRCGVLKLLYYCLFLLTCGRKKVPPMEI